MKSATHLPAGGLSLRTNFSWTLAGNIIYAASQWAMLAGLAKLGTTEIVGQFALGLALTTPVIMFANLNLRSVQATDAQGQYHFTDYWSLRLITVALALLTIAALVVGLGYPAEMAWIVLAIGLVKAVEALSDLFYGLLQQHERMDRIAQSLIWRGPLSVLLLLGGLALTGQLFWGVMLLALWWSVVLLAWDLPNSAAVLEQRTDQADEWAGWRQSLRLLRPHWRPATLWQLAGVAFSLGVVMMLISLNATLPRYVVEGNLGVSALGIFAALAYLQTGGITVVTALGQSATPRLAKHYAAQEGAAFGGLLLRLVGVGAGLGVGGIVVALIAGEPLLRLLYRAEYAQADLLVWLMVAAGISYIASFLGYGITAARHFRIQMPLFGLVGITTALASWWLVPVYGLNGAAMALALAASIQVILSTLILWRIQRSLRQYSFDAVVGG